MDDILKLPYKGVYGLFNDAKKLVYLSSSTDIVSSVRKVLKEDTRVYPDREKLRLEVLGEEADARARAELVSELREELEAKGYSFYNVPKGVEYTLMEKLEEHHHGLFIIKLYIISSRCYRQLVGVFLTVAEYKDFRNTYYPEDKKILRPIYCTNELTRMYCKDEADRRKPI